MLLFDHMLDLDLRFHLMRRTGEISKICDRGTDAMQVTRISKNIIAYLLLQPAALINCSCSLSSDWLD